MLFDKSENNLIFEQKNSTGRRLGQSHGCEFVKLAIAAGEDLRILRIAENCVSVGKLVIFLLLMLFAHTLMAQGYELVWSDEFDGESLDLTQWECMTGDGQDYGLPSGWGNNELQWYLADNVILENGLLVITAKKESANGKNYTSSRIRTKDQGDWKYGRLEFRIRFPEGKGLWSAVWMMPTDAVYGGWAASGEVDIIEHLGHEPETVHGTLHYGGRWPANTSSGTSYSLSDGSFTEAFHEFALEWEEGVMRWYADGVLYQTQNSWYSSNGSYPAPFDQRFHLLINLAVGGNWPGSPDASTTFPQRLEVDYVRVYQKNGASDIDCQQSTVPTGCRLMQNYPNPFNSATVIQYQLPEDLHVRLQIFDVLGDEVASLMNGLQNAGMHQIMFKADDLSSGTYIFQLKTPNHVLSREMFYLK